MSRFPQNKVLIPTSMNRFRTILRIWWVLLAALPYVACGAGADPRGSSRDEVAAWITTSDGHLRLARRLAAPVSTDGRPPTIRVLTHVRHQAMLGFGASLTESSAHLIAGLPASERRRLLDDLFSPKSGIALNYIRVAIGSSDYVASLPFSTFDARRDAREVMPILLEAKRRNPAIRVMATPWSAPAWMKDSGSLEGGSLRWDAMDAYADYLVGFLHAYARAGVRVDDLTVQNEPELSTSYPSMTMSADQQTALMRVLDVKLTAAGLATQLYAFDHNWDDPGYALEVLARAGDVRRLAGAAFHCYAGEPEAQAEVRATGKHVLETECSGTDTGPTTFGDTLRWQVERLLIRGPVSGAETAMTWNLALDAHGGPERGTCAQRCNGVVEIADGRYRRNAEYFVLAHASRFVRRGAHRLTSRAGRAAGLLHVAFANPDGSRVLIVLNTTHSARRFTVGDDHRSFAAALPPEAVGTFVWH
jgi:glucosylceramidase